MLDEFGDMNYYDDFEDFEDDMLSEYYYTDYTETADDTLSDIEAMDKFFDAAHDANWVVTNEITSEYDTDWADAEKWTDVHHVVTFSGHKLRKKCMNLFGRKLCLCEFIEFLGHEKHVCHPGKAKKLLKMKKRLEKLKKKKKALKRKRRKA